MQITRFSHKVSFSFSFWFLLLCFAVFRLCVCTFVYIHRYKVTVTVPEISPTERHCYVTIRKSLHSVLNMWQDSEFRYQGFHLAHSNILSQICVLEEHVLQNYTLRSQSPLATCLLSLRVLEILILELGIFCPALPTISGMFSICLLAPLNLGIHSSAKKYQDCADILYKNMTSVKVYLF